MSGHSKWSTIKRKKGVADAKRGQIFTKVTREIIMAAKAGGGDPVANTRLRMAILKAKEVNMPSDNIKRAVDRAVGDGEGSNIEEVTYEAYLQGGVAMIVEAMTDNKNRTFPEIKNMVTKAGCNMAEKGAVAYLFNKRGLIVFDGKAFPEDKVMEVALNHDVEDIKTNDDGSVDVIVAPESFEKLRDDFDAHKMTYISAEITMLPAALIPVTDAEVAGKILGLVEKMEDHDDVQNVYYNADIADEIYQQLEG